MNEFPTNTATAFVHAPDDPLISLLALMMSNIQADTRFEVRKYKGAGISVTISVKDMGRPDDQGLWTGSTLLLPTPGGDLKHCYEDLGGLIQDAMTVSQAFWAASRRQVKEGGQ